MKLLLKNKQAELDELIKNDIQDHRDFLNTKLAKVLANNNQNYGKDWTLTYWLNKNNNFEVYPTGQIDSIKDGPQQLIDFYQFSKERTKVINRYSGEDLTDNFIFTEKAKNS